MKIPYGKQEVTVKDVESVVRTLKSDFLTQGPAVEEFEQAFAKQVGSKFAVAMNNATAALHLSFKVLDKDITKKVLTTPLTFVASSNCVAYEGGHVEFVDINPKNLNIDLDLLEKTLKQNPLAYQGVIVVDFAGLPLDMEALRIIADRYNLWILEDAAHAVGGSFVNSQKQKVTVGECRYSDMTVFSFHPVKHIATGEGGMITTNNEKNYKQLLKLRSHGIERDPSLFTEKNWGDWYHEMQDLGYNYRMPDINAALGSSQLTRIAENIRRRDEIACEYRKALKDLPITFQEFDEKLFSNAYHLFVIQIEKRKELYEFLKRQEIYTQVHYLPVYWHPYYKKLGFKKGLCPTAEAYYEKCLSLPMYHSMTKDEQKYVIAKVKEFFNPKSVLGN